MAETFEEHVLFGHTVRVGDWIVEPQLNKMARNDEIVQLEPKVMQVLLCMAERPGKTVTKDRFMEEVWTGTVVTDDVLSRCISELRKALGDDSREPDYIETIRKTGYRLIAPVTVLDDPRSTRTDDSSESERVADRVGRWLDRAAFSIEKRWYWVSGLAFLGVGLLLGALLWGQSNEPPTETPPETIPFTSYQGVESDPAISPDGQQVAFVWDGGGDDNENIYVKQSSSEIPLRITSAYANDYSPAWSPDGQQVAFARVSATTHSVHVASSLGGSERRIARYGTREIHSLAWSPHANRDIIAVAVRQDPYGPFAIELIEADSSWTITSPEQTGVGDTFPVFSPDGKYIAFVRSMLEDVQNIYVVPIDDEEEAPRQVTIGSERITGLTWEPDGNNLLMTSDREGNSGLWRVPLSGGSPVWVMATSERNSIHRPSVSRQGDRLAYAQTIKSTNIWSWQRTNASFRSDPLIRSTRSDSDPSMAPDGEQVAFISTRSGYRELWVSSHSQDEPTQLTDLKSAVTATPRWSPSGEHIAFVSGDSDVANIHVMDVEGSAPQVLTDDEHNDILPSWSNDGNWIYFSSDRSGEWQIWMISMSSGRIVPITEEGGMAAQESPDGELLYLVRPDTSGIWRLPLNEGFDVPIVRASFSNSQVDDREAQSTETSPTLVVPWLSPQDRANWRVTSSGIYFVRRRTDATVLSFYHFEHETITDLAVLEDVPQSPSFDISSDGTRFLVTQRDRYESDIMLVNFFN